MQKQAEEGQKAPEVVQKKQSNRESSSSNSNSRSSSGSSRSASNSDSKSKDKEKENDKMEGNDSRVVRYKYCCKLCKHPDKSKRACVCVVPLSQRRADLGNGCRNCGCLGCSKQDYISKGQDPQYHPELQTDRNERQRYQPPRRQQKRIERKRSTSRTKRNKSPSNKRIPIEKESSSRSRSPQYIDSATMKFYNFDRSLIGAMIINDYQLNPILLGFGVPQRTYSYLLGRPK